MQSYFEVNVSLNGTHFFATSPRSITNADKAKDVVREIMKRFPKSDGFEVAISYEKCVGFSTYGKEVKDTNYLFLIDSLNKLV